MPSVRIVPAFNETEDGAARLGLAAKVVAIQGLALERRKETFRRVAARTVTAAIRTRTGERDLAVGIVAGLQTHGSRANWHPPLPLLVTDGGFRPDGTFVSWPVHGAARFTEAFRRAVLRLFVRWGRLGRPQLP